MDTRKLNRSLRAVIADPATEPRRVLHVPAWVQAWIIPIIERTPVSETVTVTVRKDYEIIYITPQPAGIRAGYGPLTGTLVVADREDE